MKIILLGGKANSGKDSSAEFMAEYYRSRGLDVVNIQIAYYIKMYAKEIAKWDGDNETKPRQLLQDLGTELIRKQIDEYFFIKRIIQDIDIYSRYFDIITISDGRLPEEFAAIKLAYPETVTVHVTRPNFTSRLTKDQKAHVTETLVDEIEYDYDLVNDGTLDDLHLKTIELIRQIEKETKFERHVVKRPIVKEEKQAEVKEEKKNIDDSINKDSKKEDE